MVAPPLKGSEDFAGKSGLETADACETSTRQTNVIVAAHFMLCGLIKLGRRDKNNSRVVAIRPEGSKRLIDLVGGSTFQFPILRFRLLFPADATIYLSCAQRAGRFG